MKVSQHATFVFEDSNAALKIGAPNEDSNRLIGFKRKRASEQQDQDRNSEHELSSKKNSSPAVSVKLNKQQEADLIRELEQQSIS